jgi:formylglycine-generating enzyme required for sulfatase activity
MIFNKLTDYLVKFSLLLSVGVLLASCSEDEENISGYPRFIKAAADTVNSREKISIYGEFLGIKSNKTILLMDSLNIIPSDSIFIHNNSKIEFNLPNGISGKHVFNLVIGRDTSSAITIYIRKYRTLEMCLIPAGSFIMGTETGLADEKPSRNVKISKDFYMSKYEVSQALWLDVDTTNPSLIKSENLPANNLTWLQAVKFCNELSSAHGLNPSYAINDDKATLIVNSNGYRLPTEAEWEYACRAGSTGDYYGELNDIAWYAYNSGLNLKQSGLKKANAYGLYDIIGNLAELCWDYYQSDYYQKNENLDPLGPIDGSSHVVRGGSFADGKTPQRSVTRDKTTSVKQAFYGLRLVRNK